jgi:hypothetical protein
MDHGVQDAPHRQLIGAIGVLASLSWNRGLHGHEMNGYGTVWRLIILMR